ncbi:DUF3267 domain-containing protein [Salisediminibacterium halotolerans]|uniref:Zincin peptidase n=1 Tax=Salisediminibacterium halotolerans TaxID=517425 RepID=A0A1H9TH06_9BACI|nr:DUF3267 domain-containing protein [Salisediminibacterium haloalkalitolerans]SER96366.1 Putative zincin peptidase [Salisediminibacterium haloalkalitolerans]
MNCLKRISVEENYGRSRLWALSLFTSIVYFLVFFSVFRTILSPQTLADHGPFILLALIAAVLPVHLLLHCMPLWLLGMKATFGIRKSQWPFFYYSVKQPMTKYYGMVVSAFPIIIFTTIAVIASFVFPHYIHYIAMMSALNAGLAIYDLFNYREIRSVPNNSIIEEHRDGFYILRPEVQKEP